MKQWIYTVVAFLLAQKTTIFSKILPKRNLTEQQHHPRDGPIGLANIEVENN